MARSRSTVLYVTLAVLGPLCIVAATVWAAVDYNLAEDLPGAEETVATPVGILMLAVVGGAMIIAALAGLLIKFLERPNPSRAKSRR